MGGETVPKQTPEIVEVLTEKPTFLQETVNQVGFGLRFAVKKLSHPHCSLSPAAEATASEQVYPDEEIKQLIQSHVKRNFGNDWTAAFKAYASEDHCSLENPPPWLLDSHGLARLLEKAEYKGSPGLKAAKILATGTLDVKLTRLNLETFRAKFAPPEQKP